MYRQDQLKPKDTRYIHRFVTNGEAGNIIVTTIQELIALLDGDAVKSFEADTTFKRVAGSFNEWEVSLFYKPLNRAITIARVYVDRASTNFFERVFDELRAVKLELTGKPIAFKALAPNGHILAFNSDMDSAQVLAAARSFLKDNNVEYSGIDANMPPEKFAPRTIKLCVMHAKRAILDFRGLVPEHDFHHLFKFGEHIHSEETLQQFSDFVRRLNGKKIQDWWDHKAVSAWIFPCLVRSLSPMTDIDWESTPSTTNIGESQHHWTNTQTSTKLSLVEAIETARIVDFRVVDDIHLALNSGVLVNPYNHAAHRATKNMARHASTSREYAEGRAQAPATKRWTRRLRRPSGCRRRREKRRGRANQRGFLPAIALRAVFVRQQLAWLPSLPRPTLLLPLLWRCVNRRVWWRRQLFRQHGDECTAVLCSLAYGWTNNGNTC